MNFCPASNLIWQWAANEAAAAEYPEIQPDHFCLAVLKFSEHNATKLAQCGGNPEAAGEMAAQAEEMRALFLAAGMDTTKVRRNLRVRLGKGGKPCENKVIHRSAAARVLCEMAEVQARFGEANAITPRHLWEAILLCQPPEFWKNANPPAAGGIKPAAALAPNHSDRDLVRLAKEGKICAAPGFEVQSRAAVEVLRSRNRRSLVLVSDSDSRLDGVVRSIACTLAREPVTAEQPWRLLDYALHDPLRANNEVHEAAASQVKLLGKVLDAGTPAGTLLVLPAMEGWPPSAAGLAWIAILRTALTRGNAQFICRASAAVYADSLRKDPIWRQCTESLWLVHHEAGTIPHEL